MVILLTLFLIVFEAITEGLLLRFNKAGWFFKWYWQWITAIILFGIWFLICIKTDIPAWKLISGFVFVRFAIFDIAINIARGFPIGYYGDTKLYDRIMQKLGSWGWWVKICLGVVGTVFLLGIE